MNRAHAHRGRAAACRLAAHCSSSGSLEQLGYKVVSVPYWEWDALRRDKDKEQAYLFKALVGCALTGPEEGKEGGQKGDGPEE